MQNGRGHDTLPTSLLGKDSIIGVELLWFEELEGFVGESIIVGTWYAILAILTSIASSQAQWWLVIVGFSAQELMNRLLGTGIRHQCVFDSTNA